MNPHPPTTPRDWLLAFAIVFVIGIIGGLTNAAPADAHTIQPRECARYAAMHAFTTSDARAKRPATKRCLAAVTTHNAAHSCTAMPGSDMGAQVCAAIIQVRAEWATDAAMHELLRRESGWNPNAVNESSGACGLFQRLPCPWRYYGGSERSASDDRVFASIGAQVNSGVRYIASRYGTPSAALAHHDSNNWY